MARRIVFNKPDGSVCVVCPSPRHADLPDLSTLANDAIANAGLGPETDYRVVDQSTLPATRRWRNAWRRQGAVISPDLVEARKVRKAELVQERAALLEAATQTRILAAALDDVVTAHVAGENETALTALDDTALQASVDGVGDLTVLDTHEPAAFTAAKSGALPTLAEITQALRDKAKSVLNVGLDADAKLKRAIASVLVDEVNILRGLWMSFKAEVAAATNLADLKARVANLPNTPDRTLAQAKTAIANRLDDGTVD
jgi:hypothetical protein